MNKKLGQPQEQKSDKSENKRPYGCPCGKYYLSYPALFTHVKQKHGGHAPGDLIKPESGKIRGRPKSKPIIKQSEQEEDLQKIIEAMGQLIEEVDIEYNNKFDKSDGNATCQDAASHFYKQFSEIEQQKCQVIRCFLNLLRQTVDNKYGESHWTSEKPTQIIEVANQMFVNHMNVMEKYPLDDQTLKQCIYLFFEWLYLNKWTDHRLMKRTQGEV